MFDYVCYMINVLLVLGSPQQRAKFALDLNFGAGSLSRKHRGDRELIIHWMIQAFCASGGT